MADKTAVTQKVASTWKHVANELSQTEERLYNAHILGQALGMDDAPAGRALRFFKGLGIYTFRSEYEPSKGGGMLVYGKLLASLDDGLTAIYRHFDAGRTYSWFEAGNPGGTPKQHGVGKGHHKAKADAVIVADERSPEVVRAIAGPEPEQPLASLRSIRKDEPEALIEAARQYANRTSEVTAHIEALRGLGVEVDIDKVMSGISLTPDPILETVSVLVPYVERLERNIDRMAQRATQAEASLREAMTEREAIRKERDTLKAANQRLSDRIVKDRAASVTAQA